MSEVGRSLSLAALIANAPHAITPGIPGERLVRAVLAEEISAGRVARVPSGYKLRADQFPPDVVDALRRLTSQE